MVTSLFLTATQPTVIYTLSLHDALPICSPHGWIPALAPAQQTLIAFLDDANTEVYYAALGEEEGTGSMRAGLHEVLDEHGLVDRKSTRLNSSHLGISYAVFCLKKKRKSD